MYINISNKNAILNKNKGKLLSDIYKVILIIRIATNQVHGGDCHKQDREIREVKWGKPVIGYFGLYKLMNSETFVILFFIYFLLKAKGENDKG